MTTNLIGQKIPNLAVDIYHQNDIKKVQLDKLAKNKWLIIFFYPADFTFVCPTELEELADLYPQFKKLNTEIVSVSTDTAYSHKAWHDTSKAVSKIKFPMAADPSTKLSRWLGVFLEDEGVALRATFIVDPDGKIVSYEINNNDFGRSAKELLRKLKAAQFVRKNKGYVCPASWDTGSKPLKPSVKLVGKI